MDRTKIVYDLIKKHIEVDSDTQKANITEAIYASGKDIHIVNDLSEILGKSHHSISDIIGHHKKFVLLDLCKIAEFLNVNVYALLYPYQTYTKAEFLKTNEELNADPEFSIAGSLYIQAETLRKYHSKEFFVWNIRNFVKQPEDDIHNNKTFLKLSSVATKYAAEICGAETVTANSWMTPSKKPAPMIDICKLATAMNVDIIDLLSKRTGE